MELNTFDLKIKDLPREVDITVPEAASDNDVHQMIEDLKAQLIYNSRYADESPDRDLKIEIIQRSGSKVKLKIS